MKNKCSIWAGIGAAMVGGIGGYFSAIKGNYFYAGCGAGLGAIIGKLAGNFIDIPASRENRIKNVFLSLLFFLSILMALAGIVAFIISGKVISLVGFIFFLCCGVVNYEAAVRAESG